MSLQDRALGCHPPPTAAWQVIRAQPGGSSAKPEQEVGPWFPSSTFAFVLTSALPPADEGQVHFSLI